MKAKPDLAVASTKVFTYCKKIGHRMGNVRIKRIDGEGYLIQISVLDRDDKPQTRESTVSGIVQDTRKLVQCGRLQSKKMLTLVSTRRRIRHREQT